MPLKKVRTAPGSLTRTEAVIWAGVTVGLLIASIAGAAAISGWASLEKVFTVGGFILSLVSLIIMIVIAQEQSGQIDSLDSLNEELRARKSEREHVKALFLANERRQYTCVMPVEYRKRPLPTIAAGDYYAWHVIQNFAGEVDIAMRPINRRCDGTKTSLTQAGDAIFLCSPQVNPLLDEIAPWLQLHGENRIDRSEDGGRGLKRLERMNLPVWFANRKIPVRNAAGDGWEEWDEKVICYLSDGNVSPESGEVRVLASQTEEDYIRAARLKDHESPANLPGMKSDMALIIRAARRLFDCAEGEGADSKLVVIAGIHQYGTWIAGDFIEKFCRGERHEVNDLFRSEADFAILVYGQFDEGSLSVVSSEVHPTDAWQFTGSRWDRVAIEPRPLPAGGRAYRKPWTPLSSKRG